MPDAGVAVILSLGRGWLIQSYLRRYHDKAFQSTLETESESVSD